MYMQRPPEAPGAYIPLRTNPTLKPSTYMNFATIKSKANLKEKIVFTAGMVVQVSGTKVVLKDPSGTIYGSLDENAMEWGVTSNLDGGRKTKARSAQAIGIGMVLVLKNIAMFTPRRGVLYFNITSKNIECVLSARMEIPPPLLGALKKIEVQEKHEDEMTITELYEARVQREAERLRVLNYIKRTSE